MRPWARFSLEINYDWAVGVHLEALHNLSELLMQTHKCVEWKRHARTSGPLKVLG